MKLRAIIVFLLFTASVTLFSGSMLLSGVGSDVGAAANATCSGACWVTVDCNAGSGFDCDAASSAQTITNTSSHALKFAISGTAGITVQYIDNGGTPTTIANNGTVTIASGHTLAIKCLSLDCANTVVGDSVTVTVTDNVAASSVGSFIGKNSTGC